MRTIKIIEKESLEVDIFIPSSWIRCSGWPHLQKIWNKRWNIVSTIVKFIFKFYLIRMTYPNTVVKICNKILKSNLNNTDQE